MTEFVLRDPQLLGPPQAPHFSKGKLQPQPSGGIVFPWRWQVRERNPSRDSLLFLCSPLS